MAQWEYKVTPLPNGYEKMTARLKELGDGGWELVSVVYHANPRVVDDHIKSEEHLLAYFKKLSPS